MSSDVPETETKVVTNVPETETEVVTPTQIIINNDKNKYSGLEISAIVLFTLSGVGGLGYLTYLSRKNPKTFQEVLVISLYFILHTIKVVFELIPISLYGIYNIVVDILNNAYSIIDNVDLTNRRKYNSKQVLNILKNL